MKKEKRKVKIFLGNGSPMRIFKIGRNELCKCGSGLKQKRCCGFETKYFNSKDTSIKPKEEQKKEPEIVEDDGY